MTISDSSRKEIECTNFVDKRKRREMPPSLANAKADSNAERIICERSSFDRALDEAANLGSVEMQESFSKEISAEDPI
jgi:hypothetical protein